ncbi:MAG: hypothetical protein M0Z54_08180 [Thermaerobacter sp.]|nr:hypothetical protein [Thermaerobacter sp.]
MPAKAILNTNRPLRDVWGSMALTIQDAVAAAPSAGAKRTALAPGLLGRLAAAAGPDVSLMPPSVGFRPTPQAPWKTWRGGWL